MARTVITFLITVNFWLSNWRAALKFVFKLLIRETSLIKIISSFLPLSREKRCLIFGINSISWRITVKYIILPIVVLGWTPLKQQVSGEQAPIPILWFSTDLYMVVFKQNSWRANQLFLKGTKQNVVLTLNSLSLEIRAFKDCEKDSIASCQNDFKNVCKFCPNSIYTTVSVNILVKNKWVKTFNIKT